MSYYVLSTGTYRMQNASKGDVFSLTAEYLKPTGIQRERFEIALRIYSAWLARAAVPQAGIEANTSCSAEHPEQPDLTSPPNNRTVGIPMHCSTGDSNK